MAQRKRAFVGNGKVRIASANTARFYELGNCPKLEFTHNEKTMDLPDYQRSGGGTDEYYTRTESVEMATTITKISPDNLARALHGDVSDFAAATAQTALVSAVAGGFAQAPTLWTPASLVVKRTTPAAWVASTAYTVGQRVKSGSGVTLRSHIVTVAGTSGGSAPTWNTSGGTTTDGGVTWQDEGLIVAFTAGTDYIASAGGIAIPAGSAIADATELDITYDRPAQYRVDAMTHGARDWALHFDGVNAVDNDAPVVVVVPLVKFGVAKSLPVIGDDFVKLEVSGRVLRSSDAASDEAYYQVLATAQ